MEPDRLQAAETQMVVVRLQGHWVRAVTWPYETKKSCSRSSQQCVTCWKEDQGLQLMEGQRFVHMGEWTHAEVVSVCAEGAGGCGGLAVHAAGAWAQEVEIPLAGSRGWGLMAQEQALQSPGQMWAALLLLALGQAHLRRQVREAGLQAPQKGRQG